MPTYQYACTACAERLEVVQRFTDDPLTECPECGGALRKVFSAVGVVFKGSGFYKTDSRGSSSAKPAAKPDAAKADSATSSSSGSSSASSSDSSSSSSDSSSSGPSSADSSGSSSTATPKAAAS